MERLTPEQLARLGELLDSLGYRTITTSESSLYDIAVAVIRFVAGVESSKIINNIQEDGK